MKIIDLDYVNNEFGKKVAAKWVSDSITRIPQKSGAKALTTEAVYFLSTKDDAFLLAEKMGLTHPCLKKENYWRVKSINQMLAKMITRINQVRADHGMVPIEKFDASAPARVFVMTDREYAFIDKIGAIPLPYKIVRV